MKHRDSVPPVALEDLESPGVSRRDFLKISTIAATVPLVASPKTVMAAGEEVPVYGPGKVSITLVVNGAKLTAELEPRVTLLDALRNNFAITGAKRVCDRGECGACTVLMDGKTVYACTILAIDAQGKKIETVESLSRGDQIHPVQQSFVDHDAQQCGFCTPGFVRGHQGLARQISQSHARTGAQGTRRQLLPLRNLRWNSRSGRSWNEGSLTDAYL